MIKAVLNHTAVTDLDTVSGAIAKNMLRKASINKTNKTLLRFATRRLVARSGLSDCCLSEPRCQPQDEKQMCVSGLNHFNISASRELIERVKRFYTDIIGLALGPRAHLDHDGYWLYAGYTPIVHLSVRIGAISNAQNNVQKGYFNHISLGCVGLESAIARMIATQTPYRLIQLPDIHQTQLFVTDPADIGVELTFFNESL